MRKASGSSVPSPGDSCYEELAAAAEAGLVSGYEDGTFRPNAPVTRQEACTMLARALRLGTPDLSSLDAARVLIRFADMEKVSAWAFADVATCVEVGIVQGRDAGNLAPEESVTRAEAAVMVARFWKK
ncbi:MAG: S-layer homology domain-containing protein [Bacillota bacterium]